MLRLGFRESVRHVVSVVATDCGGKESSPVLVTVTVTPACSTAWAGTVKTSYRSSQRSSRRFQNYREGTIISLGHYAKSASKHHK